MINLVHVLSKSAKLRELHEPNRVFAMALAAREEVQPGQSLGQCLQESALGSLGCIMLEELDALAYGSTRELAVSPRPTIAGHGCSRPPLGMREAVPSV